MQVLVSRKASRDEHWECVEWLNDEAELLDDRRMHEWLELLDPDLDYRVPVRVTREREGGSGFSDDTYHMYEDVASLTLRVKRLDTDYAWAEDPPSRARRFVSNVRVARPSDEEFEVKSNLLIYRSRLDAVESALLVGERQDLLVRSDGKLRLRRRAVLLDHSTLPTKNLAVFF